MKALTLITILFLTGCYASVEYDPETEKVKYTRMGDQKLEGVEIETTNGTKVIIGKQESAGLAEAIAAGVARGLR